MDTLKEIIANNLIKFRKNCGLTQLELAEKLKYSDKNISKWERGESVPDVIILKQLADIYNITVDDFLVEDNKKGLISSNDNKKSKTRKMTKKQALITLLSVSIVWLVATLFFGIFSNVVGVAPFAWYAFVIALPASCVVTLVFSSLWCTNLLNAIIVSLLIWLSALTIFVIFSFVNNIWFIFIVSIPLQILDILWFVFRKVNSNIKKIDKKGNKQA